MLNDTQRNLVWQIDTVCRKCIRAVMYFNAVTGKRPELWTFLQNSFGEIAVIQWFHAFNNYKDPTHFSQLFDDPVFAAIGPEFSTDIIRARLQSKIGLTADQYSAFRKEMVGFRNTYAAHWDFDTKGVVFPDLDLAMRMCIEMRDILRELVVTTVPEIGSQKHEELKYLLTSYDNKQQLRSFGLEAEYLREIK